MNTFYLNDNDDEEETLFYPQKNIICSEAVRKISKYAGTGLSSMQQSSNGNSFLEYDSCDCINPGKFHACSTRISSDRFLGILNPTFKEMDPVTSPKHFLKKEKPKITRRLKNPFMQRNSLESDSSESSSDSLNHERNEKRFEDLSSRSKIYADFFSSYSPTSNMDFTNSLIYPSDLKEELMFPMPRNFDKNVFENRNAKEAPIHLQTPKKVKRGKPLKLFIPPIDQKHILNDFGQSGDTDDSRFEMYLLPKTSNTSSSSTELFDNFFTEGDNFDRNEYLAYKVSSEEISRRTSESSQASERNEGLESVKKDLSSCSRKLLFDPDNHVSILRKDSQGNYEKLFAKDYNLTATHQTPSINNDIIDMQLSSTNSEYETASESNSTAELYHNAVSKCSTESPKHNLKRLNKYGNQFDSTISTDNTEKTLVSPESTEHITKKTVIPVSSTQANGNSINNKVPWKDLDPEHCQNQNLNSQCYRQRREGICMSAPVLASKLFNMKMSDTGPLSEGPQLVTSMTSTPSSGSTAATTTGYEMSISTVRGRYVWPSSVDTSSHNLMMSSSVEDFPSIHGLLSSHDYSLSSSQSSLSSSSSSSSGASSSSDSSDLEDLLM